MNCRICGWFVVALALILAGCDVRAHDGHDHHHDHGHNHDPHDHHDHDDELTLTRFSKRLLVFIEYQPPVAGHTAAFHVHLTDRTSGGPVTAGALTLKLTHEDAEPVELSAGQPDEPGIYDISARVDRAGAHRASLHLRTEQWEETVDLGEVVVYADDEAAHAALHDAPADPHDAIPLRIEEQWEARLHSEAAERRTLVHRLDAPARIEAAQGHAGTVAAPVEGRVVRDDDGQLPRLGEPVEAGAVLGWVELTLSADRLAAWAADRAALQAARGEVALRRLDVARQDAEARRALTEAEADVAFHRRAYERSQEMRSEGLATEEEVARADRDARAAEARYVEARELSELYAASRAELEQLTAALAEATAPLNNATAQTLPRMPLIAPIGGRVTEAPAVEGEHVSAGQPLYRLLDDTQVWVTARVGEFDLARLGNAPSARVRLEDGSGRWLELNPDALIDTAAPVAADDRAAPLRYAIDNAEHQLRPGMTVTAWIETQRSEDALAVPEDAVLMDAGRPVVFVQVAGETFEKRRVELGVRDGPHVEIRSGVRAGEHVVTRGAYTVKLAAQEPAEMGHGHVH